MGELAHKSGIYITGSFAVYSVTTGKASIAVWTYTKYVKASIHVKRRIRIPAEDKHT